MSESEEEVVFKKKKAKRDTTRQVQSCTLAGDNGDDIVGLIDDAKRVKKTGDVISFQKESAGGIELPTFTSTYDPTPDQSRIREVAVEAVDTVSEADKKLPKWMRIGKMGQTAHARAISMFDYAPDICKDFKETGRCAWGDECKFMHDRSERKSGAHLEREWQSKLASQRALELGLTGEKGDEKPVEVVPEDCAICSGKLVNPVFSKCKHIFCERCALKQHAAKKTCFTCNVATDGSFINASKYIEELRCRAAAAKEKIALKDAKSGERGFQSGGSWGYANK